MGNYWRNLRKFRFLPRLINLNNYLFHMLKPLAIRAKGMSLSVASNWLWNFGIGYATPYLVNPTTTGINGIKAANLGVKVFFIWGSTCLGCFLFTWVLFFFSLSLRSVTQLFSLGTSSFLKRKDCHWNKLIFSTANLRVRFFDLPFSFICWPVRYYYLLQSLGPIITVSEC